MLADVAVDAGGELIVLPEYCGGLRSEGPLLIPPAKSEEEHPVLLGLRQFARDRKIWMVIGSIAVTGPREKIYNRGFIVDDTGNIRNKYDKVHLFDVQLSETEVYRESGLVSGGKEAVLADTPLALIGYSICYDIRFPALFVETKVYLCKKMFQKINKNLVSKWLPLKFNNDVPILPFTVF